jgi:hypothetical protein
VGEKGSVRWSLGLLVIDDEQDLLLIYRLILKLEGYDMRPASSELQLSRIMDNDQFHPDLNEGTTDLLFLTMLVNPGRGRHCSRRTE